MKQKKKLPRFNLGAIPDDIGYQRSRKINIGTSRTFQGIPLGTEAQAAKQSLLGNSISNVFNAAQWPLQAYQNMTRIPAGTALKGVDAINSAGGVSSILKNGGTPTVGGALNEAGLPTEIGATTGKASTVVNGLSKLASVVGIGMGAGAVYNSFAHQNDRVSQDQIANSASTNVITTDGGNTYTERGGIDSQGIRDLQHQMDTQKKVNLAINAAGLGASVGSLFTPIGGLIGAGAGFALGSIANLLGFGDNEEEIEQAMRDQEDVFAMQNRQSRTTALDKDTKAAFYNRQGSANGKLPGYNIGKGVARLSGGEVVQLGPIKVEVPGKKNNKDEYIARKGTLLGEMMQNPQSIVYTNKGGISDYIKNGGDESVALEAMKNIQKNYKNGKLPGYKEGLWKNILEALPYVAPHAVSLFGNNLSQLNRAENANVYAPDVYIDNPEGAKAVNELAQLRFDVDPYYREAQRGLNWANYNARRNVGLGPGGRAIAQATNYTNYLRGLGDITKMYNEAQNDYTQKYAAALAQLGSTNQGRRMEAAAKRHAWMQQAMGQRESWIAQYRKNIDQNLLAAAADYMRYGQYRDTLGIQNKQLALWDRQTAVDEKKLQNMFPTQETYAQSVKPTDAFDSYSSLPWWKKNDIIGRSARYYNATGQLG